MGLLRLVLIGFLLLAPCAIMTAQESEPEEKPAPADSADESAKDDAQPAPDNKEDPAEETKPDDKEEPAEDDKPTQEKPKDEEPADEAKPSKDEDKPAKEEKPEAEESPKLPNEIIPRNYLTIQSVGAYGKAAIHTDPIDYLLATGKWKYPADGDEVESSSGTKRKWAAKEARDEGVLDTSAIRGGYAVVEFDSPAGRVMILRASGHAMVYVNGEPRTGDPYGYGWVELRRTNSSSM